MKLARRRAKQKTALTFAEELSATANDSISLDILTPEEKQALAYWRDILNYSVKSLETIIAAHDALQMGADWDEPFDPHGRMVLDGAMVAAFMVSIRTSDNPIKARLNRKAAMAASHVRSLHSARFDPHIIAEKSRLSKRNPGLSDRSIAALIHKSLKARGDSVTFGIVRSRLRILKKQGVFG